MPEIGDALVAFLKADPGVTALVGNRIYPDVASEGAGEDYIVVHDPISRRQWKSLNDTPAGQAGPTGQAVERIQVDCNSPRRATTRAIARAVRQAQGGNPTGRPLQAFNGNMQGVNVQSCRVEDSRGGFKPDLFGGQKGDRSVSLDLMITYDE